MLPAGEPPFPVVTMMLFGPSDTRPPPDCQMPAPSVPGWEIALQRVRTRPSVATPKIQPW